MIETETVRPILIIIIMFGVFVLYCYLQAPKNSDQIIDEKTQPDKKEQNIGTQP